MQRRENMKTKLWIIAGVLIIAFAAMVAPVLAVGTQSLSATANDQATVTFTVTNSSPTTLTFGTGIFNLAANNTISKSYPDHNGHFPVVQVQTNENPWYITAVDNTNNGHMKSGSLILANATGIQAENVAGAYATQSVPNLVPLSGSAQAILSGSAVVPSITDIASLKIDQYVSTGDTAANNYAIAITLAYEDTLS